MSSTRNLLTLFTIATGFLASPLSAAVLMLDFGSTVVTGADLTNSPYHTTAPLFTDSAWNQVQTGDVLSGLVWSDGTAATALALNLGATTNGTSTTLGLTSQPSASDALGGATNTGIYAGTSVGRDGIFTGTGTRYVGFQLGGLAAGTYDIYVASRNTSISGTYTQNLYAGASSTAGNFSIPGLAQTESVTFANASAATGAWADGSNYMKVSVTLTAGQYLNLAVGSTGAEGRGFLNSVQIVSVPEPGTPLLLACVGMLFTVIRRRR